MAEEKKKRVAEAKEKRLVERWVALGNDKSTIRTKKYGSTWTFCCLSCDSRYLSEFSMDRHCFGHKGRVNTHMKVTGIFERPGTNEESEESEESDQDEDEEKQEAQDVEEEQEEEEKQEKQENKDENEAQREKSKTKKGEEHEQKISVKYFKDFIASEKQRTARLEQQLKQCVGEINELKRRILQIPDYVEEEQDSKRKQDRKRPRENNENDVDEKEEQYMEHKEVDFIPNRDLRHTLRESDPVKLPLKIEGKWVWKDAVIKRIADNAMCIVQFPDKTTTGVPIDICYYDESKIRVIKPRRKEEKQQRKEEKELLVGIDTFIRQIIEEKLSKAIEKAGAI